MNERWIRILRTPDNAQFASCGGDRTAFVWDVQSGEQIRRLQGHMGKVNSVAYNEDASVLATGAVYFSSDIMNHC